MSRDSAMCFILRTVLPAYFLVNCTSAVCQLPETDIFLSELSVNEGQVTIGTPVNMTKRAGYDNQPFFMPNGKTILYSAAVDSHNMEVFRMKIRSGKTKQLTFTPESEYSPALMPDGKRFSVVRVEKDDSTQRLWQFPVKGGDPSLIIGHPRNVGYYCWAESGQVAVFLLGTTFSLHIINTETGTIRKISDSIGRCIQRIPGENDLSFIYKNSDSLWTIRRLDLDSYTIRDIVPTLPGSEDYAWMGNSLLAGTNGKLYACIPSQNTGWQQVADLGGTEAERFYRVAVSPDGKKLAMVVYKGERP